MPTVHLIVKGKVQGVFYRATAKKAALGLGITGWIKNNDNGDVEAIVTGTAQQMEQFINSCRDGPAGAVVEEVLTTPKEEITFKSFVIKR